MKPIRPETIASQKNVSVVTVRRAIAAGELTGVRIGRRLFVDAESAAGWRRPVSLSPRIPAA